MEHLFSAELSAGGRNRSFDVTFADETYIFSPLDGQGSAVRIRREEDEWHPEAGTDATLATACIDALERYLLRQH